jgi:hypothetical protein
VVRAAIEHLPLQFPGSTVVGAAVIGPGEKLVGADLTAPELVLGYLRSLPRVAE